MKKIALLLGVALSMGFVACDDMLPNPDTTANPELPLFSSANLEIEQTQASDKALNLPAYAEVGDIPVLDKVVKCVDFPETYDLVFKYDLSGTADFAKYASFEGKPSDDGNIAISAAVINTAIQEAITKDPAELNVYIRVAAYAVSGNTTLRIGGADKYYDSYTLDIIPLVPSKPLSNDYYLLYRPVGTDAWQSLPMEKSNGKSVYDDGNFAVSVDVTTGGIEWAVSATPTADGELLVPAKAGSEGRLAAYNGVTNTYGVIEDAMPYLIAVDVANSTYTTSVAIDILYIPNGTTTTNWAKMLALHTDNFVKYEGTLRIANTWWISAQQTNPNPDGEGEKEDHGIYFGPASKDALTLNEKTGEYTSEIAQYTAKELIKFTISPNLYYTTLNLGSMTMTLVPINSIQVIGSINGWDTATAIEMKATSFKQVYTATGVEIKTTDEFKFCVEHDWKYSFGGDLDDIKQNGGNLKLPAGMTDGTYTVKLDFSVYPNKVTLTKTK